MHLVLFPHLDIIRVKKTPEVMPPHENDVNHDSNLVSFPSLFWVLYLAKMLVTIILINPRINHLTCSAAYRNTCLVLFLGLAVPHSLSWTRGLQGNCYVARPLNWCNLTPCLTRSMFPLPTLRSHRGHTAHPHPHRAIAWLAALCRTPEIRKLS